MRYCSCKCRVVVTQSEISVNETVFSYNSQCAAVVVVERGCFKPASVGNRIKNTTYVCVSYGLALTTDSTILPCQVVVGMLSVSIHMNIYLWVQHVCVCLSLRCMCA